MRSPATVWFALLALACVLLASAAAVKASDPAHGAQEAAANHDGEHHGDDHATHDVAAQQQHGDEHAHGGEEHHEKAAGGDGDAKKQEHKDGQEHAVHLAEVTPHPHASLRAPSYKAPDVGPFDRLISAQSDASEHVQWFSPLVFDPVYYKERHPELRKRFIVTATQIRRHWVQEGVRLGWRASPNFSAQVYLAMNKDVRDRYGDHNYPWAIVHYLTKGVNEPYRETGGPVRMDLFDERVFQWKWYLENNPALKHEDVRTEMEARRHWQYEGLDSGMQASPHVNLRIYLNRNPDLAEEFGNTNYRAALSQWLKEGWQQTWRENGGETCAFWSTWCQGGGTPVQYLLSHPPRLPEYNSTGTHVEHPPLPMQGGREVAINGRLCRDLTVGVPKAPDRTRISEMTHLLFPGKRESRRCNVLVKFYTDVQTRTQNKMPADLAATRWSFDDSVPEELVLEQPLAEEPHGMEYVGVSWAKRPAGVPEPDKEKGEGEGEGEAKGKDGKSDGEHNMFEDTFDGAQSPLDANYLVSRFRTQVAGPDMPKQDAAAGAATTAVVSEPYPNHELWEFVHHYRDTMTEQIDGSGSTFNGKGSVGVQLDMLYTAPNDGTLPGEVAAKSAYHSEHDSNFADYIASSFQPSHLGKQPDPVDQMTKAQILRDQRTNYKKM